LNGTSKEFESYVKEACDLSEKLVHDHPESTIYRAALAIACNQLAICRDSQQRTKEAAELYRRAIDLREEILQAHPDDLDLRASIAETCVNFSQFAYRHGDRAAGEKLHDRAEAEFKRMLQETRTILARALLWPCCASTGLTCSVNKRISRAPSPN